MILLGQPKNSELELLVPLNLHLELFAYTRLVQVNLVDDPEQLLDQNPLLDVTLLAIDVLRPRAPVVDVLGDRAVRECLELVLSRHARPAAAAREHPRECELLVLVLRTHADAELPLSTVEELLGDERGVHAVIPFPAVPRILESPVVQVVVEQHVDVAQEEWLSILSLESRILQPPVYLSPAPPLVANLLEDFLDDRAADRIDEDPALLRVLGLRVQVARGCDARPESHLAPRPESSFYIHTFIIIFKFRLRSQNHEQKFLTWIICESLTVSSHF